VSFVTKVNYVTNLPVPVCPGLSIVSEMSLITETPTLCLYDNVMD